ncbi:hypothetical protein CPB86DRAFT_821092 [Serendipita vermifera]|nr:hypothetical protein CPB86DRAFT_821092 [Serendipita vermifera]
MTTIATPSTASAPSATAVTTIAAPNLPSATGTTITIADPSVTGPLSATGVTTTVAAPSMTTTMATTTTMGPPSATDTKTTAPTPSTTLLAIESELPQLSGVSTQDSGEHSSNTQEHNDINPVDNTSTPIAGTAQARRLRSSAPNVSLTRPETRHSGKGTQNNVATNQEKKGGSLKRQREADENPEEPNASKRISRSAGKRPNYVY